MLKTYIAPTREQISKALGARAGEPITVTPRKCQDTPKFMAKLNRAYAATKKSKQRFD